MELTGDIEAFVKAVASGAVEVYNEFSLQHELGIFLRNRHGNHRVQFERNVSYFDLSKASLEKKEIDVVVMPQNSAEPLAAIELKYPRNGQIPEQMFSFCRDIAFLEQLRVDGFRAAYFLAFVDDSLFYSGNSDRIYGFFRGGVPITGNIRKPTGAKDKVVHISGTYTVNWQPVAGSTRYCLLRVSG